MVVGCGASVRADEQPTTGWGMRLSHFERFAVQQRNQLVLGGYLTEAITGSFDLTAISARA